MHRVFAVATLAVLLAAPLPSRADGLKSGHWRVTTLSPNGNLERTHWLLNVETKDGKTTATLAAANPQYKEPKLVSFRIEGQRVHAVLKFQVGELTFDGTISAQGAARVPGVVSSTGFPAAAYLAPTELATLEPKDLVRNLGIKEMDRASALSTRALLLRRKARLTKDAEQRAKLGEEAVASEKEAAVEVPKLYRAVVAKHPQTYAAGRAALLLLQNTRVEASDAELRAWSDLAFKSASEYGPALEADAALKAATALLARKGHAALAVEAAQRAVALLEPQTPALRQVTVLETLARVLKQAGKTAELAPVAARLAKLEAVLDKEYLAKMPPFKPAPYAGRKSKSDRAVVMELFTGAQCPPCVAADVAFDALQNTYKPTELVLIQYHLHIPGPDPLTNATTVARAKYYGANSTPTTLFNGSKKAGGGGPLAFAQRKYDAYCAVIDPLLDTPAACQLTATARRVGDKLHIEASVNGMTEAGPDKKLRLLLVEESIRYVGSNRLRFHHHVVRAMPGGPLGTAVTEKRIATTAEVDLATLRQELTSYLDNFAAKGRPFPRAARPMDLHDLRVIALVQDDATREILQAVQVEVKH